MVEIFLGAITIISAIGFVIVILSLTNVAKKQEINDDKMSEIIFAKPKEEKTSHSSHSLNAVA